MKIIKFLSKLLDGIKNNWKIIIVGLNGVLTIIMGILTVIIALYANNLTETNNELYKKEIYPHFRVINTIENQNEKGEYCDEVIRIKNYGGNFYKLDSTAKTYILFESDGKTYMMPLLGYFFVSQTYSDGDIVRKHYYPNNNWKIADLIIGVNNILWEEDFSGSYGGPITYVKIAFQDVFGKYATQYFRANDSELLDNDIGEKYVDSFNATLKWNGKSYTFDIDTLTVELLYEFATTDLKNAFLIDK